MRLITLTIVMFVSGVATTTYFYSGHLPTPNTWEAN
ncbi:unnamed protein product, partial [Rotaria sp. Silwood2]